MCAAKTGWKVRELWSFEVILSSCLYFSEWETEPRKAEHLAQAHTDGRWACDFKSQCIFFSLIACRLCGRSEWERGLKDIYKINFKARKDKQGRLDFPFRRTFECLPRRSGVLSVLRTHEAVALN